MRMSDATHLGVGPRSRLGISRNFPWTPWYLCTYSSTNIFAWYLQILLMFLGVQPNRIRETRTLSGFVALSSTTRSGIPSGLFGAFHNNPFSKKNFWTCLFFLWISALLPLSFVETSTSSSVVCLAGLAATQVSIRHFSKGWLGLDVIHA